MQLQQLSMHISHVLQDPALRTIRNPVMNMQMQSAINNLGPIHPAAGRLGVLRVVVSYPGDLDENTVEEIADDDQDEDLLATINLREIVTRYEDIQAILSLSRKRSAEEDGGSQPKRPRVKSSRAKGKGKA
jgi:hypothetical protein